MPEVFWLKREDVIKTQFAGKPLLIATPDIGLISIIAAAHLIQNLKAELIGYIDADWVPPISIISNGDPLPPIRIYATNNVNIILSEAPLPPTAWRNFAISTYNVIHTFNPLFVIGAIGIPNIKRMEISEISELRVFFVGKYLDVNYVDEDIRNIYNASMKFTGTLAGPYSAVISLLIKKNIPFIFILIDSYPEYPDPEAAARFIQELNKLLQFNVEVKTLIEKGAEIRLMARQLAIQMRKQQAISGQKTGSPPIGMYV